MKFNLNKKLFVCSVVMGLLTFGGYAPKAEACSPLPPGVYESVPQSGASLPANAAMVLTGNAFSLDDLQATLDGEAATLVEVGGLSVDPHVGYAKRVAVKVSPTPTAGQELILNACTGNSYLNEDQNMPSGCSQFEFTVIEPDSEAPAELFGIEFNVFDHAAYEPGCCFCQSPSDAAVFFRAVGASVAPSFEAQNFVHVQAYRADDTAQEVAFETLLHLDQYEVNTTFRLRNSQLGSENPADAYCYKVQVLDASMNLSGEPTVICDACRLRNSDEPIDSFSMPPNEPEWSSADAIAGGVCLDDPCEALDCPDNTHCVPREGSGESPMTVVNDCVEDKEPECNKECPDGERCELTVVSCITTPCPPIDTCVPDEILPDGGLASDPCASLVCPRNTHCESNGDSALTVSEHCIVDEEPSCELDCPPGSVCELMEVMCVTSPCPPLEYCVDVPDGGASDVPMRLDAGSFADESLDSGTDSLTEEFVDGGASEELLSQSDAGPDGESLRSVDAGTNDGEPPLEFMPNGSDSSSMNCSCASYHKRSAGPVGGLLLGLLLLGLFAVRRSDAQ